MSRKTLFIASLLLLTAQPAIWADSKKEPVAYVNPMIGTDGYGNVYPGPRSVRTVRYRSAQS